MSVIHANNIGFDRCTKLDNEPYLLSKHFQKLDRIQIKSYIIINLLTIVDEKTFEMFYFPMQNLFEVEIRSQTLPHLCLESFQFPNTYVSQAVAFDGIRYTTSAASQEAAPGTLLTS